MSLGLYLEIMISLFKWWNSMFNYWTLMIGMYLKPFWSVKGFKICSWSFLCHNFCLYVLGTQIDKSCLQKLHITIYFHFSVIFIANHINNTSTFNNTQNAVFNICPTKFGALPILQECPTIEYGSIQRDFRDQDVTFSMNGEVFWVFLFQTRKLFC